MRIQTGQKANHYSLNIIQNSGLNRPELIQTNLNKELKNKKRDRMITTKDVKAWITSKEKLDNAKSMELKLRLQICEHILDGKAKGSKKATVGKFILTATAKLTEKVDPSLLDVFWPELTAEEKDCIKFKPSLKAKEFHKLKDAMLLHRAVDSKPGTPTLILR